MGPAWAAVGVMPSESPTMNRSGMSRVPAAAMAEVLVSAAARFATARTRASRLAQRMLAPPPMEWPEDAKRSELTSPKNGDPGSAPAASRWSMHQERSRAKARWFGKKPPAERLAITR